MDNNSFFIPNYGDRGICFTCGQGVYLQDTQGRSYLDFGSGVAVNSLGYSHPVLVEALKEQADKLWHSSNLWHNEAAILLATELTKRTGFDKIFLCNSGLEANEAALKLARKYGNKNNLDKNKIVCFSNAFHGRSLFTIAVSGKPAHREPFKPLPEGIIRCPFNDCAELEATMDDSVCAIILEPVQGEGGVIPATKDFLRKARELCDKYKALLIFDEIQCGMGRTGQLFAFMDYAVVPDLMTCAKGLGGGFPIGALLAKKEYADCLTSGSHGNTFGGNALAAAVAHQVLMLIDKPELLKSVREHGEYICQSLKLINEKYNCFSSIRGKGLLWGCSLKSGYSANDVKARCLEKGLLVLLAGDGDILRLAPPLIIDKKSLCAGILMLQEVFAQF